MEEETEERTDDQQAEEASDAPGAASEGDGEENPDQAAIDKVAALEDDPPQNLEDWPDDEAKYKTFGGAEGGSSWDEGPTSELGDSDVRHHDDGSVSVKGEKVDDPEEYKGDPIPGGPTDPDSPSVAGEKDLTGKGTNDEGSGDDDSGEESSGESDSDD
jgi:hypothetical protein